MTFNDTGLQSEILQSIAEMGFEEPTPIQEETIPFLLNNTTDLIALAQTGTGKTAAFSLPILQQLDFDNETPQCLILCPTRELCLQIAKDIKNYSSHMKKVKSVAIYGGTPPSTQKKALRNGVHIVVGTPGRTLDLIRQRALDHRNIRWMVLDEADEMLNMGFQDDLEAILKDTPKEKQTLLFSATMPKAIERMAQKYMSNPHRIQVARQNIGAKNVEHHYYMTHAKNRFSTLRRLVDAHPEIYGIIFCRTRVETQKIADKMMSYGYNAECLHGDMGQAQRDQVMNGFKQRNIQLLIATDVASRGIDVEELTHVINYQLPDDPEIYVHRSGRTGRAGNKGISICIVHSKEGRKLKAMEEMVGKEFERKEIPSGEDIVNSQFEHFLQELKEYKTDSTILKDNIEKIEEAIGDLPSDVLVNRLFSMQLHTFLEAYKDAEDLNNNQTLSAHSSKSERSKKGRRGNWVGYTIQMGAKDQISPKRLISMVNDITDSNDIPIGDIVIQQKFTYFEIDPTHSSRLEKAFQGTAQLQKATSKPSSSGKSRGGKGGGGRRKKGRGRDRDRDRGRGKGRRNK